MHHMARGRKIFSPIYWPTCTVRFLEITHTRDYTVLTGYYRYTAHLAIIYYIYRIIYYKYAYIIEAAAFVDI